MSERPRAIVHLDLDAFFAAVEVLENPSLAGKPLIVGGRPGGRGVVTTASYAARTYGVRSAMPTFQAMKLCPEAIVVPPRHQLYSQYSRRVMAVLREATPLMQQVSIDEAFLDLTDQVTVWDETVDLARAVQVRVRDEIGLSASLGVASNRLVAKVASDQDKPGGLTVVRPGEEAAFLAPLPVRALWGIGPVTAERLAELGVITIGDLARLSDETLRASFGRHGPSMACRARGIDDQPLVTEHEIKTVSQETTFDRDLADLRALKVHLWKLSQGVARRLARHDLVAGCIALKLRYANFETLTRQMSLAVPTADELEIYRAALGLLEKVWQPGQRVRLLGVGARHLCPPTGQLALITDAPGGIRRSTDKG
jgi:DNA polymerase-4